MLSSKLEKQLVSVVILNLFGRRLGFIIDRESAICMSICLAHGLEYNGHADGYYHLCLWAIACFIISNMILFHCCIQYLYG